MNTHEVKILFLGTPNISAYVLEALILNKYNIIGVVSQEDKEFNRKHVLLPTATKIIAQKYGIPVYQFDRIRLHVDEVAKINPDLIITLAYGQLVPQAILNIPKFGCLNLHGSLLPKYRGAAPIQRSIINGETKTGITLMQMIDKMDAGLMYAKKMVEILPEDNYSSLVEKMKVCAADTILENIDSYLEGGIKGIPQNENEVTFANKILKEDEKLSLALNCKSFINFVRGLSYTPGGYLTLDSELIKIYKTHLVELGTPNYKIGEIISATKNGIYIQLNDGIVSIDELQKQQKNKMKASDFVNGCKDLKGKVFE